jgi:hypothetical protein
MTLRARFVTAAAGLCGAALLAACGSPVTTSAAATAPSASASPSGSATAGQHNTALQIALTVDELASTLPGYTQTGDGLLGNTPNTDARVFSSPDGATKVELDLAADTSPTAALGDYAAYSSAAQKQVTGSQSSSAPNIGVKANETVGTDVSGHSIASLSFVQGSVIGVVTVVSTSGTVDPAGAEHIALLQVAKIKGANL